MIIRMGAQGGDVGRVQQLLIEAGYPMPIGEMQNSVFGSGTYDAVRAFQVAHVDRDGHALTEDGVVGGATMWALEHPGLGVYTVNGWRFESARAAVAPVMAWARTMLGVHEVPDGSNRGPLIDKWTGCEGQPRDAIGPPWCAYFVSAAFATLPGGGSPFGVISGVVRLREWAVKNGCVLSAAASAAPMPGDVFIILRSEGHGHTGLICGRLMDGRVATIEGNCANAVRGLVRDRNQFACIIRPVKLG